MQQIVEFCPQEKLIHTGVQPEHDHHDARQTAVHIDKTMGIIEINSKNAGSDHPSDGAGYCSRQHSIVVDIKNRYQGKVDAIFHNGDSELESSDPVWEGIHVVRGNCDYDSGYPERLVVKLGDVIIAQTHGHLYGINFTWDRLDLWAQQEDADICLYGHLHAAAAWRNGKTVFINPGSVSQPRGPIHEKLYAKVIINSAKIRVEYYTRDHELYSELTQEFER